MPGKLTRSQPDEGRAKATLMTLFQFCSLLFFVLGGGVVFGGLSFLIMWFFFRRWPWMVCIVAPICFIPFQCLLLKFLKLIF